MCYHALMPRGMYQRPSDAARFWSQVDVGNPAQCWLWRGATDHKGYGRFWWDGRTAGAHRYAFEDAHPGEHAQAVLHTCDNPPCCNPSHLRGGTLSENMRDRDTKERQARGSRQGSARFTEDEVLAIRARHAAGETGRQIADSLNIGHTTIYAIINRRNWRHI